MTEQVTDAALELAHELGVGVDPEQWALAHVHRSWAYENGGVPTNERLEFLGDAVLELIVTEFIYVQFPDFPEGQLARLRAAVVNTHSLAKVARSLGMGQHILLGNGETATGGHDKDSILADAMESIIGAIFMSSGIEGARTFVHHIFDPLAAEAATLGAGLDWKTSLQEKALEVGLSLPSYDMEATGPDHDRDYAAWAVMDDRRYGPGHGKNKKHAEQEAASMAYKALVEEFGTAKADA